MRTQEERKEKMQELREVQNCIDIIITFLIKRNLKAENIYSLKKLVDSSIIAISCIELGLKVFDEEKVEEILEGDKI